MLSGLDQGQRFETFIMSPESPRAKDRRVGFPKEHQFACEEILKTHEFRVLKHDRIGFLFKRKLDIQTKALLVTGAFITRLHDP